MTVRIRIGSVTAPNAPVAIQGDELAAVQALGTSGYLWRAHPSFVIDPGSADFEWRARHGGAPLRLARTAWPDLVDGDIPYLAWSGGANRPLRTPLGAIVLPQTSFALVAAVYQSASAAGVIMGTPTKMTLASEADNTDWVGMAVGSMGNTSDLTVSVRGQDGRITAPDAHDYRDNAWHIVTMAYRRNIDEGNVHSLRLRVDGVEIAQTDGVTQPLMPQINRELQVGAAGNETIYSPLSAARINSIAVMPGNHVTSTASLDVVEGYLAGLVGVSLG